MVRSSLGQKSCCWMRLPQSLCSMLKEIFSDDSAAEKSFTGMETSPKAICADAMTRGMWRRSSTELQRARRTFIVRCGLNAQKRVHLTMRCVETLRAHLVRREADSERIGGDVRSDCGA